MTVKWLITAAWSWILSTTMASTADCSIAFLWQTLYVCIETQWEIRSQFISESCWTSISHTRSTNSKRHSTLAWEHQSRESKWHKQLGKSKRTRIFKVAKLVYTAPPSKKIPFTNWNSHTEKMKRTSETSNENGYVKAPGSVAPVLVKGSSIVRKNCENCGRFFWFYVRQIYGLANRIKHWNVARQNLRLKRVTWFWKDSELPVMSR